MRPRRLGTGGVALAGCLSVSVVLAGLTGLTGLSGLTGTAFADPLSDAKAQAGRLQAQVSKLQVRAEQASEVYDATEAALGQLVVEEQQAAKAATLSERAADDNRTILNSRARALYMSGGRIGLYASVLDGQDPGRLLAGLHSVQAVSLADSSALRAVSSSVQDARLADANLAALLSKQDALSAQAASASADIASLLAQQQQVLDTANSHVLDLEAQLQAKLDAENAARAAEALAQAEALAEATGFTPGNASQVALTAIAAARTQIGKPYVYGGSGPDSWDCSGLTQWAYRQAGVNLPRTAAQQYAAVGQKVPLGQWEPGDLLFWATDTADASTIHHVAIYLGGRMMIAAPHTGTVVQVQPVYLDGFIGAVRIA